MRIRAVPVALGLVTMLGAACSSDDPAAVGSGAPSEESIADASHNDADVAFAQSMVAHHEQAIEMAQLAIDRAADERVRDLAGRIEAAQTPEIEQMRTWLAEWGASTESDMDGMDHGGAGSGSGMMPEEDMGALAALSGADFDRTFLEMMIGHHEGALSMADEEIAKGESPDALSLAAAIKSTQEREIMEMDQLLEAL